MITAWTLRTTVVLNLFANLRHPLYKPPPFSFLFLSNLLTRLGKKGPSLGHLETDRCVTLKEPETFLQRALIL